MNQLARQFEEDHSVRYGITTMCVGLGMGATVIWENPHHADYSRTLPGPSEARTLNTETVSEGAA
jgi:acetyl-CoA acyltransferase